MKITSIETYHLVGRLERPFGWSQGWIDRRQTTLLKVCTDAGICGWGEGGGAALAHGMLASILLGADPMNRVGLWERMLGTMWNGAGYSGAGATAISAVDIALWDISGKALGLPVADLVGGRVRDRIPVYATGLYYTEGEFPDRLLAEARGYVEQGFTGMKTKVGGLSIEDDVRRVKAIRDVIGPDIRLAVDANVAYNPATAIRMGRRLEELDVQWFEEPVATKDIDGYLQVKAGQPLTLAGGEGLRTRFEFRDFLARGAFAIAQPDVGIVGGISELRNVALMANAFGVNTYPHVWGSPVMIAASLHVASTIPLCPQARNPLPYQQESVMEFDCTPNPIRETLARETFAQSGSFVAVPDGPGLGVEIDAAALERLCVDYQITKGD